MSKAKNNFELTLNVTYFFLKNLFINTRTLSFCKRGIASLGGPCLLFRPPTRACDIY
jgi:hypothetical protein